MYSSFFARIVKIPDFLNVFTEYLNGDSLEFTIQLDEISTIFRVDYQPDSPSNVRLSFGNKTLSILDDDTIILVDTQLFEWSLDDQHNLSFNNVIYVTLNKAETIDRSVTFSSNGLLFKNFKWLNQTDHLTVEECLNRSGTGSHSIWQLSTSGIVYNIATGYLLKEQLGIYSIVFSGGTVWSVDGNRLTSQTGAELLFEMGNKFQSSIFTQNDERIVTSDDTICALNYSTDHMLFDFNSSVVNRVESMNSLIIQSQIADNKITITPNSNIITTVLSDNVDMLLSSQNGNILTLSLNPNVIRSMTSNAPQLLNPAIIDNRLEVQMNPNILTEAFCNNTNLLQTSVSGNMLNITVDSNIVANFDCDNELVSGSINDNKLSLHVNPNLVCNVSSTDSNLISIIHDGNILTLQPNVNIFTTATSLNTELIDVHNSTEHVGRLVVSPSSNIVASAVSDNPDVIRLSIDNNRLSLNLNENIITQASSTSSVLAVNVVGNKLTVETSPSIVTNFTSTSGTMLGSIIDNTLNLDIVGAVIKTCDVSNNTIIVPSIIENTLRLDLSKNIITRVVSDTNLITGTISDNCLSLHIDPEFAAGGVVNGNLILNVTSDRPDIVSVDSQSVPNVNKLLISANLVNSVELDPLFESTSYILNNKLTLNLVDTVVGSVVSSNPDILSATVNNNQLLLSTSDNVVSKVTSNISTLLQASIVQNSLDLQLSETVVSSCNSSLPSLITANIANNSLTLDVSSNIVSSVESSIPSLIYANIISNKLNLTPSTQLVVDVETSDSSVISASIVNNKLKILTHPTVLKGFECSRPDMISSQIVNGVVKMNIDQRLVGGVSTNNMNILSASINNNTLQLKVPDTIVNNVKSSNSKTLGVSVIKNVLTLTPSPFIVCQVASTVPHILDATIDSNCLTLKPCPTTIVSSMSTNTNVLTIDPIITNNTLVIRPSSNVVTRVDTTSNVMSGVIQNNTLTLTISDTLISRVSCNSQTLLGASIEQDCLQLRPSTTLVNGVLCSNTNFLTANITNNLLTLTPSNSLLSSVFCTDHDVLDCKIVANCLELTPNPLIVTSVQSNRPSVLSIEQIRNEIVLTPSPKIIVGCSSNNKSIMDVSVTDNHLTMMPSPLIVNKLSCNGIIRGSIENNEMILTVDPSAVTFNLAPGLLSGGTMAINGINNNRPDTIVYSYEESTGILSVDLILKTINNRGLFGPGNVEISAATLGLSEVSNTSDANKPISIVTQRALDTKLTKSDLSSINSQTLVGVSNIVIDKVFVGLPNVDNVSDINKPVSIAVQAVLDTKVAQSDLIVTTFSCPSEPTNILGTIFNNNLSLQVKQKTINSLSLFGVGNLIIDSTFIGLGNVDNTADLEKPISKYVQESLDTKQLKSLNLVSSFVTTTTGLSGVISNNTLTANISSRQIKDSALNTYSLIGTNLSVITIDKTFVGLSLVDNVADLNKPIGTATQTALDLKQDKSVSIVTAFATTTTGLSGSISANTLTANLTLNTIKNSAGTSFDLSGATSSAITVNKTFVGLSLVDNVTDLNKPISTATQTALDLKQDKSVSIVTAFATTTTGLSGSISVNTLTANLILNTIKNSAGTSFDLSGAASSAITVNKTFVGLSLVDNVADLDKPVSNACRRAVLLANTEQLSNYWPLRDSLKDIAGSCDGTATTPTYAFRDRRRGVQSTLVSITLPQLTGDWSVNYFFSVQTLLTNTNIFRIDTATITKWITMDIVSGQLKCGTKSFDTPVIDTNLNIGLSYTATTKTLNIFYNTSTMSSLVLTSTAMPTKLSVGNTSVNISDLKVWSRALSESEHSVERFTSQMTMMFY